MDAEWTKARIGRFATVGNQVEVNPEELHARWWVKFADDPRSFAFPATMLIPQV